MTDVREALAAAAGGLPEPLPIDQLVRRGRRARRHRVVVQAVLLALVAAVVIPAVGPGSRTDAVSTVADAPVADAPEPSEGGGDPPTAVPEPTVGVGAPETVPHTTVGPVTVNKPRPSTPFVPPPKHAAVAFVRYGQVHLMNDDGSEVAPLNGVTGEYPSWSPDGDRMLVSASGDDATQLFEVDVATGARRQLTHVQDVQALGGRWSPDGTRIAYWTYHGWSSGAPGHMPEVWVMDGNGGGVRRLAEGSTPAWSADGSRVLFATSSGLATVAPDGTGMAVVPNSQTLNRATWSPDGRWIAAMDWADARLVVLRPDGSDRTVIGSSPAELTEPSWFPDSRRIAYQRSGKGFGQQCGECDERMGIFTVKVDGSDDRQLTTEWGDTFPAVRPR